MLGVVIWSAEAESKAIIWCEDHGDLAFFGQSTHKAVSAERFDEGDLIQFDLAEMDNLRFARNPRRIATHHCSDLSSVISTVTQLRDMINEPEAVEADRVVDNVVPLFPARPLKDNQELEAAAT